MPIHAPRLRSIATHPTAARRGRARAHPRPNPELLDTSRLELNPESLLADMKELLRQMQSEWPALIRLNEKIVRGDGSEDDNLTYSEHVLNLFIRVQFGAILIEAFDQPNPEDIGYDETLARALGVLEEKLSNRLFMGTIKTAFPSETELMLRGYGVDYTGWMASALARTEKSPGRVFETMLLLLIAASDMDFGLGVVWNRLIGEGYDSAAQLMLSDVSKTGFQFGRDGGVDGEWVFSNWDNHKIFMKIHGRQPFRIEFRNQRLKEAFLEGYSRGAQVDAEAVYFVRYADGTTDRRQFDGYYTALNALVSALGWDINQVLGDGWYASDEENTDMMLMFADEAGRTADPEGQRAPQLLRTPR